MTTTGDRIRRRREEIGMTQEELARKLGYTSATTVSKLELGANNLRQSKIKALADALQTTPEYIMGWTEQKDDGVPSYYHDPAAAEIAEFLHKNPHYKVLFDASRRVAPEDIDFVRQMIERTTKEG